jgi:ribose 5-phosphate isomerase B
MSKRLIIESDVVEIIKSGSKVLRVDADTVLTPSAKDAVLQYHIQIVHGSEIQRPSGKTVSMPKTYAPSTEGSSKVQATVAIGSDHGGFRLKEVLRQFVVERGYAVIDVGTDSEEACDYPDYAFAVARLVESGQAVRGIMIDGVGVASAIVANKVPGIRAVPCHDEFVARSSREHNNANVLTLGGRLIGAELAKSIVGIWLDTEYAAGRHEGRLSKIADVEKRYTKDR